MGGRRRKITAKPNVKVTRPAAAAPLLEPFSPDVAPATPATPASQEDSALSALLSSPPRTPRTPGPALSVGGPKTPQALQPPMSPPLQIHQDPLQELGPGGGLMKPPEPRPTAPLAPKRRFACTTELDASKFTMADLAYWNPKKGQRLGPQPGDDVDRDLKEPKHEDRKDRKKETKPSVGPVAGPRVVVGADGELVVDEESLVIDAGAEAADEKEKVHEGSGIGQTGRRISNFSFRRKRTGRHVAWGAEETDRFFMCLSAAGTDFFLLKEFFPNRTVYELKRKYRIEHKHNPARIDQAFTGMKRLALDPMLYELVETKKGKHRRKKARLDAHIQNTLVDPRNPAQCAAEEALAKEYDEFSSDGTDSEEEPAAPPRPQEDPTPPPAIDLEEEDLPTRPLPDPIDLNDKAAPKQAGRVPGVGVPQKLGSSKGKSVTATRIKANVLKDLLRKAKKDHGDGKPKEAAPGAVGVDAVPHLSQSEVEALLKSVHAATASQDNDATSGGDGGGNLLLLHEKSEDPSVSDVIHVYLMQDPAKGRPVDAQGRDVDDSEPPLDPDQPSTSTASAALAKRLEEKSGEGPSGGGSGGGGGTTEMAEVVEFVDVDTVEPEPLRLLLHQDPHTNVQYYTTPSGEVVQWVSESEAVGGGYGKTIDDVVETVCAGESSQPHGLILRMEGSELPPPPQIRLVKKCRVRSNMAEIPSVSAIVDFVAAGGGVYEDLFPAEVAEMEYHDRKVQLS